MAKKASDNEHDVIVKLLKASLAGVGGLNLVTGSFVVTTLGTATAVTVLYLSGFRRSR
ncbi:hypothetical protein [Amycolatopsis keratiniphila]|uniref:hypothetical protein n=1 Tax=Amycolatopsis keratiniphila TaxID=129921 RepID=UPI000A67B085|nr:hypothetical protein [Amycolatopsis keratiniphila]